MCSTGPTELTENKKVEKISRNKVLNVSHVVTVVMIFLSIVLITTLLEIPSIISNNELHKEPSNTLTNQACKNKPDLSFIVGSRNDNYGSNPILRLRFTLQNLILYEWNRIHNISVEIVVVEWNPVSNNPHLWQYDEIVQLLQRNTNKNHCQSVSILFYSIPSYYNDKINCNLSLYCPYYEYHAKNVGIRRANAEWKVIMNIDDIWGHNLLNFVGTSIQYNLLDKNGIYQSWRNQINMENVMLHRNVSDIIPVEKIKNIEIYDNNSIIQKCLHSNSYYVWGEVWNAAGDFTLIHNSSLYNYYGGGYLEMCANVHLDTEFVRRQIIVNSLNAYYIKPNCSYHHISHESKYGNPTKYTASMSKQMNRTVSCEQAEHLDMITTNRAAGDFINMNKILLHKMPWTKIYKNTDKNWGIKYGIFKYIKYY
eukprot:256070_1